LFSNKHLINFLFKYHFGLLFVLFELISFIILVQSNNYHRASFVNSSERLIGGLLTQAQEIKEYFLLKESNQILANENAILRNKLKENYASNRVFMHEIRDSIYNQHYRYVPARIINNSINKQHNYITLNKGSKNGIKPEMGVIVNNQVVGIVKDVSKHFSTVISLLNKHLSISGKIKKNNYYGSVHWTGKNYEHAELNDIPFHVNIEIGDSIITTGFSTIFPENVFIGIITDYSLEEGENFYQIDIDLATDFKNLSHVYIIDNLLKDEQQKLELTNND